jgi:dihydropteroate synthase
LSNKDTSFTNIPKAIDCNGKILDFEHARVMGILNITPDSFYDGGKHDSLGQHIEHCEKMLEEGADIIDIGAFSSRPGAATISFEEEKKRLLPVLENLVKLFPEVIFSIDTFRSRIAMICHDMGAGIINDISGGKMDDQMFETIAKLDIPYILMHMKGKPDNMQILPIDENAADKVGRFFKEKVNDLDVLGFNKIILDPGYGFGKTLESNYELLRNQNKIRIGEFPLLAGISRKSMIYKLLNINPEQALNGTITLNTLAILNGANILRVHDVKEAVEIVKLMQVYNAG